MRQRVPHALFFAVGVKVLWCTVDVFLVGPLVRARSLCSLSFVRFLYGYVLADVARCVAARIIPIRSVALRMVCTRLRAWIAELSM